MKMKKEKYEEQLACVIHMEALCDLMTEAWSCHTCFRGRNLEKMKSTHIRHLSAEAT